MPNILKKLFMPLILAVLVFNFLVPVQVGALDLGMDYAENLDLPAAEDSDVRDMAVTVVRYLITFLGIIAVVIILYGGFVWMTAAGNDDRVSKAKSIIVAGIIGLIVIMAAFAIVNFVINMTNDALDGDL
ncbi:hypothetical protein KAI65_04205 [Candidatus Parcubacteria bacterium]|nr:hypothetical protein [Candidatus Parcubacteria bacterium]